jgi:hypothetical protein
MTQDAYRNGAPRYLATMKISRQSGLWICRLEDHEAMQAITVASPTLEAMWGILERGMADPDAWRDFASRINKHKGAMRRKPPPNT